MSSRIDPAAEYRLISSFYSELQTVVDLDAGARADRVPEISNWSVSQQIVHISMANSGMWRAIGRILSEKEPAQPDGDLTELAVRMLDNEELQRGTLTAPEAVEPDAHTEADLQKWTRLSKVGFVRMAPIAPTLPELSYFLSHPLLGPLNARQWLRSLRIHSQHHLSIIHDIMTAAK